MSREDFYYSTDNEKYVPIKTDISIKHSNTVNPKSKNKIGYVFDTDSDKFRLKEIPKNLTIYYASQSNASDDDDDELNSESTDSQITSESIQSSDNDVGDYWIQDDVSSSVRSSDLLELSKYSVKYSLNKISDEVLYLCNVKKYLSDDDYNATKVKINEILSRMC